MRQAPMRSRSPSCCARWVLVAGRQFITRAAEAPIGESGQTEPKNPPDTLADKTICEADEQPPTSSLSVIHPPVRSIGDDGAAGVIGGSHEAHHVPEADASRPWLERRSDARPSTRRRLSGVRSRAVATEHDAFRPNSGPKLGQHQRAAHERMSSRRR